MIKAYDKKEFAFLNPAIGTFLIIVLFFCTTNSLLSFPLDKLIMVLCLFTLLAAKPQAPLFRSNEILVILILAFMGIVSSLMNATFHPMIFFPVIGSMFTVLFAKEKKILLSSLYYGIFIHTLFAILFVILAYIIGPGDHVWPLTDKGLPFIFSARGFTPTVQTYGTLCTMWLMLFFIRKEQGHITSTDKWMYVITTLAILLTLNRSTYLFWTIILFFKMRKLFWMIVLLLLGVLVRFWEEIIAFLSNKGSLVARSELLEGFNLAYVQSGSWLVYLFGRGNNELSPSIVEKVKWDHRSDIENGYAMILHTFGALGLCCYTAICLAFIWKFIRIRRFAEAIILVYFLFVSPYITQEFVSTTFYLFLATMLYIYNYYRQQKKISIQSADK